MDPSLSDEASKTRKQDSDATVPEQENLAGEADKRSRNTKREQNDMLLMNAMRTTAAHSKLSFTPITAEAADTGAVETPAPAQPRSSSTPAPGSQEMVIKGSASSVSQSQEPSKGPTGGGKKKKKRMCILAPVCATILTLGFRHLGGSTFCSNVKASRR